MSEQASRPRGPFQAAADRPLLVADIVRFAKHDCARCHGAGFYIAIFHAGGNGETREATACRCALKAFKKLYGEDIVLVGGAPHWRLGRAPALPAAATTTAPATTS